MDIFPSVLMRMEASQDGGHLIQTQPVFWIRTLRKSIRRMTEGFAKVATKREHGATSAALGRVRVTRPAAQNCGQMHDAALAGEDGFVQLQRAQICVLE